MTTRSLISVPFLVKTVLSWLSCVMVIMVIMFFVDPNSLFGEATKVIESGDQQELIEKQNLESTSQNYYTVVLIAPDGNEVQKIRCRIRQIQGLADGTGVIIRNETNPIEKKVWWGSYEIRD